MIRSAVFLLWSSLAPAAVTIRPDQLPWAIVGRPYSPGHLILQAGGTCLHPDARVRVVDGTLPEGLELDAYGSFSGVPRRVGIARFVVEAANACGSVRKKYEIVVSGAAIVQVSPRAIELVWLQGSEPPAASFQVRSTWPGMTYSIESVPPAPWLKCAPRAGRTPDEGSALESDSVSLSVIPDKLAPGMYQTQLLISAWDAANRAVVTIRLKVVARQ